MVGSGGLDRGLGQSLGRLGWVRDPSAQSPISSNWMSVLNLYNLPPQVLKGKLHGSIDVRLSVMSVNKKAQRVDLDTEENIYHLKVLAWEHLLCPCAPCLGVLERWDLGWRGVGRGGGDQVFDGVGIWGGGSFVRHI